MTGICVISSSNTNTSRSPSTTWGNVETDFVPQREMWIWFHFCIAVNIIYYVEAIATIRFRRTKTIFWNCWNWMGSDNCTTKCYNFKCSNRRNIWKDFRRIINDACDSVINIAGCDGLKGIDIFKYKIVNNKLSANSARAQLRSAIVVKFLRLHFVWWSSQRLDRNTWRKYGSVSDNALTIQN